jgi:hypothetical protein
VSRKLKVKVNMLECPACRGFHAHWWLKSRVAPPSCAERQARKK